MALTAGDIMTPLDECLQEDEMVLEAARQLVELHFAPTPIVSASGRVRGSLKAPHVLIPLTEGKNLAQLPLSEIKQELRPGEFAESDLSVPVDSSLEDVKNAMAQRGVAHALVEEEGSVIGVVAPEDVQGHSYEAPDGLSLPPPKLIRLVLGPEPPRRKLFVEFIRSGARIAQSFRNVLERHAVDVSEFATILDFGCGCGRVIRHWSNLEKPSLYGCDYNADLVGWCRENLLFGEFVTNELTPPLPFDDDAFDFIYAFSVFTHLDHQLQMPWITELRRITKPGGFLVLTVHGLSFGDKLPEAERERFLQGELVVVKPEQSGKNECSVFHPERYIRETWAQELSVVEIARAETLGIGQDAIVLRNALEKVER